MNKEDIYKEIKKRYKRKVVTYEWECTGCGETFIDHNLDTLIKQIKRHKSDFWFWKC